MEKKKKPFGMQIGGLIITSAVIWGAVIIGCSYKLKGSGCFQEISNILIIGLVTHFFLIWTPLGLLFRSKKDDKPGDDPDE